MEICMLSRSHIFYSPEGLVWIILWEEEDKFFKIPIRNEFPHLKSLTCQNLEASEESRKKEKDSSLFKEMLVSMAMLLCVWWPHTMHILLGSLLFLQTARLPPHGTWCNHMSGLEEGFVFKTWGILGRKRASFRLCSGFHPALNVVARSGHMSPLNLGALLQTLKKQRFNTMCCLPCISLSFEDFQTLKIFTHIYNKCCYNLLDIVSHKMNVFLCVALF